MLVRRSLAVVAAVGAVALGFSYAKDPIAGIRPIEEMQAISPSGTDRPQTLAARAEKGRNVEFGATKLVEIATPLATKVSSDIGITPPPNRTVCLRL